MCFKTDFLLMAGTDIKYITREEWYTGTTVMAVCLSKVLLPHGVDLDDRI